MSLRSVVAVMIFVVVIAGLVFGSVELLLSESATTSAPVTASPRPPPPPSADQGGQKAPPPSVPPVPTPAVPVPPVTAPAYPVAASSADLVPARAYLKNTEIPPKGAGAYGLVALHARPTSATAARLMLACTAFVSSLERQADLPSSVAVGDQMLTIWPLDDPSAPEAKADKCQFLLEHYDIYSADAAMKDAAKQKADFRGRGPFLIGWSPSDTRGKPDKLVLVIDMSAYTTQADFEHAFRQWKDKIVQDPQLWRQGWSLENLRLVIRDFADRYGHDILFAAHLSDGGGKKN